MGGQDGEEDGYTAEGRGCRETLHSGRERLPRNPIQLKKGTSCERNLKYVAVQTHK
jgi:hypothetical protein